MVLGIGCQRKRQVVLRRELLMRGRLVGRNAYDHGVALGEGLRGVAEFAGLLGAARRIRLGEKEQHHPLAAVLRQIEPGSADGGRAVPHLDCHTPKL